MEKIKSLALITLFLILTVNFTHAKNNRGLQRITIKNKTGDMIGLYQESHALVIGVSQYTHGWPKLAGVKFDVKKVTKALRENGFHVIQINNPNAQALRTAFEQFINRYGNKPQNRLLFYFAGHGFTIKPKWGGAAMGYIVPTDAPNPHLDMKGFKAKALPMQRIEEYALSIDAKHGLFLFDSCFSGSLFAISRAIPENISYKTAKPVRQFITAGSASEQVPDISIFRQQFISGLKGEADLNQDHYITATELGEFLQEKVINYSKGAQHPQYGKIRNPYLDKGDFVFTLPTNDKKPLKLIKTGTVNQHEERFWNIVKQNDDANMYQAYLDEYPRGHYIHVAKIKLKLLNTIISEDKKDEILSNIKIKLYQPTLKFLKQFEDIIPIKGKIIAKNNKEKQILTLLRNNHLILIPIIEGNEYYTYDNIPVGSDGNFNYSWPISATQINGRRFWLGIFDVNGTIKPRERYNISPLKKAKYVSEFIQFN